ncbi:MAG: hypothetical protein GY765_25365 [bacterium]|nr:hypothetical protein [bacterium]
MNTLRKSIALFIIIFVGMPVLVSIIWSVGVTKAVVSPKFLSEIPQEIIEKVPDMVDDVLEEIDREDMLRNLNSRAWVRAIVSADTSPKELLKKTGVLDWMQGELTTSLRLMGDMLRGDIPIRPIMLDMRPLKEALRHEAIKEYLIGILKDLPPCNEENKAKWLEAGSNSRHMEDLPACRPVDLDAAAEVVSFVRNSEIDDIDDEINLMGDGEMHSFPEGINIAKTVVSLTYLLFLIPLCFILLSSIIGGTGKGGFFRWMGITTLVGGGISYLGSFMLRSAIPWAIGIVPEANNAEPFQSLITGKCGTLGMMMVDHILKGINSVAGAVCIVGLIFLGISFFIASSADTPQPGRPKAPGPQPTPPQPAPPQPTPPKPEPTQPEPKQEQVIEAQFIEEKKPEPDNKLVPGDKGADIEHKE